MSIERILVALDDSPRAPDVLAEAAVIARLVHVSLRVYRVLAIPPEFPPAAATVGGDALPAYLRRAASDQLAELVHAIPDVRCEVVIEESQRPWRAILRAADAYDADLIVIGSHGYDVIDRLLGTTAAKVVNAATRNVLVVHRTTASTG